MDEMAGKESCISNEDIEDVSLHKNIGNLS